MKDSNEKFSFTQLQAKYQNFYSPQFLIEVNGKDLLKESAEVFGVTVNNTLEGADTFSFTVNNPKDASLKDFKYLQNGLFNVKNKVVIKIGYGDRTRLSTLLVGIINSVNISFPANGISQLTISGYDNLHTLTQEKQNQPWGSSEKPVTYSYVVRQILKNEKYKFAKINVEDTHEEHHQIKQEESDYNFIKSKLADKIGFEFFVRQNELYFRKPANDKPEFITTLEWGRSLMSFSPTINIANQVSEVQVRHWDEDNQQAIVGIAKKGDEHGRAGGRQSGGDIVKNVVRHYWKPVDSQKHAEQIAKSLLDNAAQKFITGDGECIGIPDILPGYNIKLNRLGKKFSKVYYIEKVTHRIDSSGYKTSFSVKRSTI